MKLKSRKPRLQIVSLTLVLLVGTIAVFSIWLYTGTWNASKQKIFTILHLPTGKAGDRYLWANTAQAYLANGGGTGSLKTLLLDTVAAKYVTLNEEEITAEQKILQKQTPDTGISRTSAKHSAYQSKLKTWYASQNNLEPSLHETSDRVRAGLLAGESFQDLAAKYSEDKATKWFGGDMGLIDLESAVPEYAQEVAAMTTSQTKVVYTRHGVHVVELVGLVEADDTKLYQLREIVILPKNYESWYIKQTQGLQIKWFVDLPE